MGIRLLSVVGARPQFVKAAAIARALDRRAQGLAAPPWRHALLHTGQHYDEGLSAVFFRQLALPEPDWNLDVGSASHALQTASMVLGIDEVLSSWRPDRVIAYGDTNSTLAVALSASKRCVPIAHVEAGLRSWNRSMPEEVNRVVTDRLSDLLFCPTAASAENLRREGMERGVHLVGDIMYDACLHDADRLPDADAWLRSMGLCRGRYALATVHRAENTDPPGRLADVVAGLDETARSMDLIVPLHPRTRDRMGAAGLRFARARAVEPVGYFEMLCLERNASVILTDSGGVQKEAFIFGVPCVTLRAETEWVETVDSGWNRLAPGGAREIAAAALMAAQGPPPAARPPFYGDGRAAERILDSLLGSRV